MSGDPSMKFGVSLFVAAAAMLALMGVAEAASYSQTVQKACRSDYRKFCSDYGLDSPALRSCMNRAGRGLSKTCVNALVKSGYVSRKEVERRKKR
jgi:hypothetical protein